MEKDEWDLAADEVKTLKDETEKAYYAWTDAAHRLKQAEERLHREFKRRLDRVAHTGGIA